MYSVLIYVPSLYGCRTPSGTHVLDHEVVSLNIPDPR